METLVATDNVFAFKRAWVESPSADGTFPYLFHCNNIYVGSDFVLDLPEDQMVSCSETYQGTGCSAVYGSDEYRLYYWFSSTLGTAEFVWSAKTREVSDRLKKVTVGQKQERKITEGIVPYKFWYWAGQGSSSRFKDIYTDTWESVANNYSQAARDVLDPLMKVEDPKNAGKIMIFYGPAGTGKTSLIRCLSQEWKDWARFEVVQDPENLLNISGYLTNLLLGSGGYDDDFEEFDEDGHPVEKKEKWRVVVLEDCDELIGRQSTNQQLSKILNAGDGLLGQGSKVMFCLTANDSFADIHPAISRPGRCLANVEVGRLTYGEAERWLGTSEGLPASAINNGITLAEVYSIQRGDYLNVKKEKNETIGQYV